MKTYDVEFRIYRTGVDNALRPIKVTRIFSKHQVMDGAVQRKAHEFVRDGVFYHNGSVGIVLSPNQIEQVSWDDVEL